MKKAQSMISGSSLLMTGILAFGLQACGSSAANVGEQATITSASSPGSALQSALNETSEGLASSTSAKGSLASPDITTAEDAELLKGSGCVARVTNPSPLDPNNLPDVYSVSWTYTNCMRRFGRATLSGTRQISVTLDSNTQTRTVAGVTNLTRDYPMGAQWAEDSNSLIVDQGARTDANNTISRTATLDGNAIFTAANGNERFNHTFSHQLTLHDTFDPNSQELTQRVIDGTGVLHHNLLQATTDVTYNAVTYQPQTCGWPVAGSMEVKTTFKDGSVNDETYTYAEPCGSIKAASGAAVIVNSDEQ